MEKISTLGIPMSPPRQIQEVQASKLGDAQGMPFFINKNIRSSFKTLYFYCFIYYVLFVECQFFFCFSLFNFLFFNKLGWTPACLCGRETRSAFSLEYSCASLIFIEYSCLDIFSMLPALILHASLVQRC